VGDKKRFHFWRWSDFKRSDYLFLSLSALMLLTLKLNDYGIGLDSAIYASVARNIAESGNWLSPTYTEFYHTQFAEHPPLVFWMLALVFKLFGANDVTARLISILTGWGSILLVYAIGCRIVDRCFGFIAAAMLLLTFNYSSISTKTKYRVFSMGSILKSYYSWLRQL
jgi:4-amino-4-deoxy-L-arabinose transferase-like glycosyltransferase